MTWKTYLMIGHADPRVAGDLGTILGTIHAEAPNHPQMRGTLADTSLFDELRIDPYYRTIARAHPEIAPRIEALIAAMDLPPNERTLVLGDFSPKNILVHSEGLILLDFECAHRGDATFDLGFFLSHLILKTIHLAKDKPDVERQYMELTLRFWNSYLERIGRSRGSRMAWSRARLTTRRRACWPALMARARSSISIRPGKSWLGGWPSRRSGTAANLG